MFHSSTSVYSHFSSTFPFCKRHISVQDTYSTLSAFVSHGSRIVVPLHMILLTHILLCRLTFVLVVFLCQVQVLSYRPWCSRSYPNHMSSHRRWRVWYLGASEYLAWIYCFTPLWAHFNSIYRFHRFIGIWLVLVLIEESFRLFCILAFLFWCCVGNL